MTFDESDRPSASKALNHEWLSDVKSQEKKVDQEK